jgi:hypothetical protein
VDRDVQPGGVAELGLVSTNTAFATFSESTSRFRIVRCA